MTEPVASDTSLRAGATCGGEMEHEVPSSADTDLLMRAAREFGGFQSGDGLDVLDFGCGQGSLVRALRDSGVNARGCDFAQNLGPDDHLDPIPAAAYRLPYPDASFDLVVSTSVFEHAQATEVCMTEIHRVLKPGGMALHVFPGKWYLPVEPHIYVPFVNWLWPLGQRPWLALWALAGIRNEFQQGLSWREVTRANVKYVREGLCYRTTRHYNTVSDRVFGNHEWPMRFYVQHASGGAAALARRLPFRGLMGLAIREFREGLLIQRKS